MAIPDILLGLVVPACVAGVIVLLAWRPWRVGRSIDGRWAGSLAIGAGYALGYARLVGDFHFPPVEVDNWVVYSLFPTVLIGALGCWLRPGPRVWLVVAVVLCATLVWLLVRPLIGQNVSAAGAALRIAVLAMVMTLWWVNLNQLARRGPRALAPAVAVLVAFGLAMMLGGNGLALRGGFPCASMAAILVAMLVIAAITRHFTLAGGATLALTVVLLGTLIYGYLYIYPEPTKRLMGAMWVMVGSPLLAWVGWLRPLHRRKGWQRGVIGAAAVLLGVGAAVALAGLGAEQPGAAAGYTP